MKEPTEVLKNKMIEVQNVLGDAIKDLESMIAKPTPSGEMEKPRFNKPSDQNISDAAKIAKMPGGFPAHQIAWAFGVYKQLVAFMEQEKQETDQALGEFIDRSQRLEKNVEAKKALISQLIDKANNGQTWVKVIRKERDESRAKADLFENKWVAEIEKQNPLRAEVGRLRKELDKSLAEAEDEINAAKAERIKGVELEGRLKIVDHDKDDLREEIIKIKAEGEVNVEKGRVYLKNQLANLIDERDRAWDLLAKRGTELKNLEACLKSAQDDRDEWKGSSLAYEKSLKHEIDLASEKIKELKECRETPPCTDHTWIRERIKGKLWEFCAPRLVE